MARKDYVIAKIKTHRLFMFSAVLSAIWFVGLVFVKYEELPKAKIYFLSGLIVLSLFIGIWQWYKQWIFSEELEKL